MMDTRLQELGSLLRTPACGVLFWANRLVWELMIKICHYISYCINLVARELDLVVACDYSGP